VPPKGPGNMTDLTDRSAK